LKQNDNKENKCPIVSVLTEISMRYEIVPVLSSSSMFLHEILLPQLKLTYSSVRKGRENLCSILPHYSQFDL